MTTKTSHLREPQRRVPPGQRQFIIRDDRFRLGFSDRTRKMTGRTFKLGLPYKVSEAGL
jgi:hypothetical protein